MNYCINFYKSCPCLKEVQEITIKYSKGTDLLAFAQEYPKQRINIYIDKPKEVTDIGWNLIATLCGDPSRSFYAKINYDKELIQTFINHYKCRFFIEEICSTWEKVYEFLSYGVSDVYVGGELGFELSNLAPIIHKAGAAIRAFPNVAQGNSGYNPKLYAQFFIRPEDIENSVMEQYIDTVEFFGDMAKQHIYFNTYHKHQRWFGDLKDLIIDLNTSIDNRSLEPSFFVPRLSCRRKCIKGENCRICSSQIKLANISSKYGLFKMRKKKK